MKDFIEGYYCFLEDNFAEEAVEEYKRNLLGIQDMREIYNQRCEDWGCHTDYQINLQLNKQTGLYCIQHNFLLCNDLLINHLLVEQLWSNKDQVDWKRVTNCFDYEVVNKMSCILTHPLVWIPTEDVGEYCVVVGKVAGEVSPPRNYYFEDKRYEFHNQLREQGLVWFADTLPTVNDIYNTDKYDKIPENMILWDRLLEGGYSNLYNTMKFVIEKQGYAKAIEIIELLRQDWNDIITLKLFDFWKLEDYKIENYRLNIFDRMDPFLRSWKKQVSTTHAKNKTEKNENIDQSPKVFISYSWDDEKHEDWVLQLATDLRSTYGIDVILDKWETKLGKPLPDFMANSVSESKRVICIMTPNYKKKSDGLKGGVGLEYSIISSEIQRDIKTEKFIPLFRSGEDAPIFLQGRNFIDMRDDTQYDEKIEELARDILGNPKHKKPTLGETAKF